MSDPKKKDETGQAFGEGALRGLTLGLSDQFLSGFLTPDVGASDASASLRARRDENKGAAVVGELAGAVVNPASRIAAGASTVRGAVALGAAEGGLWGLGSAITEDALGDQQALSEHLAARVGAGALTGAAISGAVQKVLGGVERLTLSEEAATLPETLKKFTEKATSSIRKSSITDDAALREAGITWDGLHTWAKKEGLFNRATTAEGLFEQADVASRAADDLAGAAVYKLDELGLPNVEKLAKVAGKLADDETLALVSPGLASKARAARGTFDRAADPGVGAGVEQSFTWVELAKTLRALDEKPTTQPLAEALRDVAMAQAKKLDPSAAKSLSRAFEGRKYANFLKQELVGSSSSVNMGDALGAGAVASVFSGPASLVTVPATMALSQGVRARAPFVVASALEKLPDTSVLKPLAESLLVQLKARLNMAPELLGPFRVTLENAVAGGAAEALSTHMQLADGPNGDEYLSTLGLVREAPEDVAPLAQKAAAMSALFKVQQSIKLRIDEAVRGLDKAPPAPTKSEQDYKQAYDAVQKLLEQPPVDDKLSALPGTQMGLTAKLAEAARHVWEAAPRDPHETLPPAIRPKWEPTAMEQSRFLARAQAAFQPLEAISAVLNGERAQERMATLAALYPRLMEQTTERLFERLNSDKALTWSQKQRLVPFLGTEALGLAPQQVAIIASTHAKAGEGPQEPPRVDGRQVVDQNKNMQTQAQRIENRRSTT